MQKSLSTNNFDNQTFHTNCWWINNKMFCCFLAYFYLLPTLYYFWFVFQDFDTLRGTMLTFNLDMFPRTSISHRSTLHWNYSSADIFLDMICLDITEYAQKPSKMPYFMRFWPCFGYFLVSKQTVSTWVQLI